MFYYYSIIPIAKSNKLSQSGSWQNPCKLCLILVSFATPLPQEACTLMKLYNAQKLGVFVLIFEIRNNYRNPQTVDFLGKTN